MSPDISRLKGKINKWLGVTTDDRKQELDTAVKPVKTDLHNYGDRIPPQRVPHTERSTS